MKNLYISGQDAILFKKIPFKAPKIRFPLLFKEGIKGWFERYSPGSRPGLAPDQGRDKPLSPTAPLENKRSTSKNYAPEVKHCIPTIHLFLSCQDTILFKKKHLLKQQKLGFPSFSWRGLRGGLNTTIPDESRD